MLWAKSKCWQRGTVKPSTCLGKREGSHPRNLAIASLQDSCCEEGSGGEVNLGADHSLSESNEGLHFWGHSIFEEGYRDLAGTTVAFGKFSTKTCLIH